MAATNAGLSTPELDAIRATLQAGRRPRVVFTAAAGQIAGQAGQVVALSDPPVGEWIVVRFGNDELPFSPADLALPARAPAAPAKAPRPPRPAHAPPAPAPHAAAPHAADPSTADPHAAGVQPAAVPPPRQEVALMSSPTDTAPAPKKAARVPKPKPPAALTVTLSYVDGEWFVGAQQGSKALARPYTIKAAEALRMVALLDVPGVQEAVEQIVSAERAATQAHADRLRAELAEIEARLADLPGAGR